ncbi:MAG: helix-turn-helix domain-containing protein [Oscillospiraceae bacterium]|jgi:AraC-like DNA-binding protein|nr:helix-turn-helix domain-containing protein [Oscillospiraceae bacterium]
MPIYPVQPFFLLNTTRYYKMRVPDSPIVHFYAYRADAAHVRSITAVPDGCVDILLSVRDGCAEGYAYGTVTQNTPLVVEAGCFYCGVRFRPGYMPAGLNLGIPELVNTRAPLDTLAGGSALIERVAQCRDLAECVSAMRRFLGVGEAWRTGALLQQLIALVERRRGDIRIADLAEETGYSARYIGRVFSDNLGLAPKSFAKFIRFQSTIGSLNAAGADGAEARSLTELAAARGYYDQSHFIREFRDLAAVTPGEYVRAVDLPNYRRKIEYVTA